MLEPLDRNYQGQFRTTIVQWQNTHIDQTNLALDIPITTDQSDRQSVFLLCSELLEMNTWMNHLVGIEYKRLKFRGHMHFINKLWN